ncbi:glycosyl hydrolase family 76-domain-containing protein [Obelidium mucronatum]|nr:glycosyl hydrolase family 76-domain-containing protein [Obelidium mucronatum]
MNLIAALLPILALTAQAQNLDLGNKDAVTGAARAAIGPLKQYFNDPNTQGGGAWREQSGDRWVVQWHESGMYHDLFFQYALASGDGSSNGFAAANVQAASNGRDFLGVFTPDQSQDGRWNDDIAWWAVSSISGAEAGAGGNLRGLASTTFDDVWMSWDDKCGGGIYWSRNRNSDGANPYLKSSITNVQMMDLGARLGHTDKANQIWNWMKSAGLVVDDGKGGLVILDRVYSNDCSNIAHEVYSYHAGEAMTALSLMGNIDDATKLFNGLRNTFGDGSGGIGPASGRKDPTGYLWPVYKGLSYLFRATGDAGVRSAIAATLKANAGRVLAACTGDWDCMRSFGAGAPFTLLQPDGKNVRDQFEAVALLTALIPVSGGASGLGSVATKGGSPSSSSSSRLLRLLLWPQPRTRRERVLSQSRPLHSSLSAASNSTSAPTASKAPTAAGGAGAAASPTALNGSANSADGAAAGGSSNSGLIAFGVIAAVVVLAVAGFVAFRQHQKAKSAKQTEVPLAPVESGEFIRFHCLNPLRFRCDFVTISTILLFFLCPYDFSSCFSPVLRV